MSLNQTLSVAQRLLAGPGGADAALSFLLDERASFGADASYWSAVAYLHTLCGHGDEAANAFKKAGELRVRGAPAESSSEVRRMGRVLGDLSESSGEARGIGRACYEPVESLSEVRRMGRAGSGILGVREEERKEVTGGLEARIGEGNEGACFGGKRGIWKRRELFGIMDSLKKKAERFLGRKGVEQGKESGTQGVREELNTEEEEKEIEELNLRLEELDLRAELREAASRGPSVAGLMGRMRSLRLMGDNIVSAASSDREIRKGNVAEKEVRTKRKESTDARNWPGCSKMTSAKWRDADSDSDPESFDGDLNRGDSEGSRRIYREMKSPVRNTSLETGTPQGSVGISHTTHKNYVAPARLADTLSSPLQRSLFKWSRSSRVLTSTVSDEESSEVIERAVSILRPSEEYCSDLDDNNCWRDYSDCFSDESECSFPCFMEDHYVRRTSITSSPQSSFEPPATVNSPGRSSMNDRSGTADESGGTSSLPDRIHHGPSDSRSENRKRLPDQSPHALWDFSGISDLCSDDESFRSSDPDDDAQGIWSALEDDGDSDDEGEVSDTHECLRSQVGDSDAGEFDNDQDSEEERGFCTSDCDHFADSEQDPESTAGISDAEISAQWLGYFLDSDSEEELEDGSANLHEENHPVSGPQPDDFPYSRQISDRDQERASLRRVNSAPSLGFAASEAESDFPRGYEEAEATDVPEAFWIEDELDDDDVEGDGSIPQYYEFVSGHVVEVFEDSRGFFYRFSTEAGISDLENISDFEDESDSEGIDPKIIDEIAPKMSVDNRDPKAMDSCVICYEPLGTKRIRTLPCSEKHCYHAKCIDRWLESNVTCPNCRVDLRWSERALNAMRVSSRGRHAEMEGDAL